MFCCWKIFSWILEDLFRTLKISELSAQVVCCFISLFLLSCFRSSSTNNLCNFFCIENQFISKLLNIIRWTSTIIYQNELTAVLLVWDRSPHQANYQGLARRTTVSTTCRICHTLHHLTTSVDHQLILCQKIQQLATFTDRVNTAWCHFFGSGIIWHYLTRYALKLVVH